MMRIFLLCLVISFEALAGDSLWVNARWPGGANQQTLIVTGQQLQAIFPMIPGLDSTGIWRKCSDTLWVQVGTTNYTSPNPNNFSGDSLQSVGLFLVVRARDTLLCTRADSLNFSGWRHYVASAPPAINLISHGDFESTEGWLSFDNSPVAGSYVRTVSAAAFAGSAFWRIRTPVAYAATAQNVQVYTRNNFVLEEGGLYELSCYVYGNKNAQLKLAIRKNGAPYTYYGLDTTLTYSTGYWAKYTFVFVARGFSHSVSDAYFQALLAWNGKIFTPVSTTVSIDEVKLIKR